jgi:mono/diheme cytochrome c family protein
MGRPAARLILGLGIALMFAVSIFPQVRSIELPPDNAMAELRAGPGVETARANCVACHSTDYIVRQPGGDAKRWEGEVKKMITVFGAPIREADAKTIVDYLAAAYGPVQANTPKENPPKPEAGASKRKAAASQHP